MQQFFLHGANCHKCHHLLCVTKKSNFGFDKSELGVPNFDKIIIKFP